MRNFPLVGILTNGLQDTDFVRARIELRLKPHWLWVKAASTWGKDLLSAKLSAQQCGSPSVLNGSSTPICGGALTFIGTNYENYHLLTTQQIGKIAYCLPTWRRHVTGGLLAAALLVLVAFFFLFIVPPIANVVIMVVLPLLLQGAKRLGAAPKNVLKRGIPCRISRASSGYQAPTLKGIINA